MGNQYFQAFCAIAYALKHGLDYHIPAHTLNDSVWNPAITHLENPEWNPSVQTIILTEKSHAYEEIPFKEEWRNINIVIDGYRQSELYFKDYLIQIREIMLFDCSVKNRRTVALHVRRGDYVKLSSKHPCVTYEYICESAHFINGIMPLRPMFIVFSDDIDWCKNNLIGFNKLFDPILNADSVLFSEGKSDSEDFLLMLGCANFIISNSTFSLIAAILSDSQNKICISPSKENWFGEDNKHLSTETIIPDYFHQIKY